MMKDYTEHGILKDDRQLGPYPDHLLKRVDHITVETPGPQERRVLSDSAAAHVRRGDYGPELAERVGTFIYRYPLGPVISEVRARIANNALTPEDPPGGPGVPPLPKLEIPDDPAMLSRNVKGLAYFLGADAAGICVAPTTSFFASDYDPEESELKNAIVFMKRNDLSTTLATDGQDWIVDATAHRSYLHMTMVSEIMVSYIRMLGFKAMTSDFNKSKNQIPALAIHAGLAEPCRIGIALNPFFGADFKASAVLTDMPLLPDKPIDFGLQEYCSRCTICADNCLGGAISKGKKEIYNGYEKWVLDADKCAIAYAKQDNGTNCYVCIMLCPWTRPNSTPEDYKSWDGSIESLTALVDARADEIRRNKYVRKDAPNSKWWLKLEDKP